MVSDRQKYFNKFMDSYIKDIRKSQDFPKLSRKPKVVQRIEVLEEHELEIADENIGTGGLWTRFQNFFFGSKVIIEEESFETKPSYVNSLSKVLWGGEDELEEQEQFTKVVFMKPQVEREVKDLIKIVDVLLPKINDKNRFFQSKEYRTFSNIKKRHNL